MADNLELFENLKTNMKDPEKLLELAKETWPALVTEMTTAAREIIHHNEVGLDEPQMWDLVSQYWPLIVADIVQDIEEFYTEFQETTVAIDITDLNTLRRVLSEMRPELMDQLEVSVVQGWQQCTDLVGVFKEEDAWGMLEQMWTGVTTCVREELKKRGVVGKVEMREMLKVLVQLVPELFGIVKRELGKMNAAWLTLEEGSGVVKGDMQDQSEGDKGEETEVAEKEKKETEDINEDVVKGSEAGDASSPK